MYLWICIGKVHRVQEIAENGYAVVDSAQLGPTRTLGVVCVPLAPARVL